MLESRRPLVPHRKRAEERMREETRDLLPRQRQRMAGDLVHPANLPQQRNRLEPTRMISFVVTDSVMTDTRYGCSVNADFFLVPAESLVISACDTIRMDSVGTDFHLLHTSFLVPTRRTCWIQQTN